MSDTNVVLITGAARGIGFDLVKLYAADASNTIIAGVRDTSTASKLDELAKTSKAKIHLVKILAGDAENNKTAADEIEKLVGKVDVLWANAGIAEKPKPILQLDAGDMTRHYEVNTLGPLFLFQAFYPLLQKSSKAEKKFIITSTLAGSIGAAIPFPITSYGASKAAVNFVAIHIHLEHAQQDNIVVVPIHPGMVDTDMASAAIDEFGGRENIAKMGIEILSPEQSATGCKAVADAATVESHGGKFFDYAGKSLPW